VALTFEWDSRKARSNFSKHGISFEEASTIFGDSFSLTVPDPDHSITERRYITVGRAFSGNLLVVVHTDRAIISASSAPDAQAGESADFMNKKSSKSERNGIRDEYDFSQGRRGKYARRYAEGTNVVVLEPDVAKVFPTSKKVNASLRKLIRAEASA
jgi:uncharacterized DUF497 family protein